MEAIIINPETRNIRMIKLRGDTPQEIGAEIAAHINVRQLSGSLSPEGGLLLFTDKWQLETNGCSFVLEETLGKHPIFGKAMLLPYKSKQNMKAKLIAMQYEARFFTKSYSNTLRQRIKEKRVPIPADEGIMGRPAKYFLKTKSEKKRNIYTPPSGFAKFTPMVKNAHIKNLRLL